MKGKWPKNDLIKFLIKTLSFPRLLLYPRSAIDHPPVFSHNNVDDINLYASRYSASPRCFHHDKAPSRAELTCNSACSQPRWLLGINHANVVSNRNKHITSVSFGHLIPNHDGNSKKNMLSLFTLQVAVQGIPFQPYWLLEDWLSRWFSGLILLCL